MDRAYSVLDIKAVDEEHRVIEGWATTPKVDRMGDIVEPLGVEAAASIPMLLHHDSRLPVGRVELGKATKKGIPFKATLPRVDEPGAVKDRVDEAWHSVKYRLIAAVSIGFRVLDGAVERVDTGLRFLKTEVMELSLVAIPAQDQAVITQFRSFCAGDADLPATIKAMEPVEEETEPDSPEEAEAATGQKSAPEVDPAKRGHVAKLVTPARVGAPFVINRINHLR